MQATHNLALVNEILSRMLPSGDVRPLLNALADDVVFTVAASDTDPDVHRGTGKAAVLDYFLALGDLVAFWRVRGTWSGARVVVLLEESFTLQPGGLSARSDLALLFDVSDGTITRLCVVEDPQEVAALEPVPAGRRSGEHVLA